MSRRPQIKPRSHREWVAFLKSRNAEKQIERFRQHVLDWGPIPIDISRHTPELEERVAEIIARKGPGCGCCASF